MNIITQIFIKNIENTLKRHSKIIAEKSKKKESILLNYKLRHL